MRAEALSRRNERLGASGLTQTLTDDDLVFRDGQLLRLRHATTANLSTYRVALSIRKNCYP